MSKASPLRITSLQNDRIKAIRALDMRKTRRETGLFVAEGAAIVISAREHAITPETIVYEEGSASREVVEWALGRGVECLEVAPRVLEKIAHRDNPQAIIGVFRQRWSDAPRPEAVARTWLALEEVRDPGNLGTIIRTAHAVGAGGIMLVGTCCDPFQRECVRATMGSIFAVPLARLERADFLALVAAWPGDTVGTDLAATLDFRAVSYRPPVLLTMGSEGPGLSGEVAARLSRRVKIPMAGGIDSLNLAIATALALYEIEGASLSLAGGRPRH